MGTKFRTFEQKESEAARKHGLKYGGLKFTYNYLQNVDSNDSLSPWHDIELIPSTLESNHVTGVIEIPVGTTAKMEVDLT
jgi:inorganic pyrophosphatase